MIKKPEIQIDQKEIQDVLLEFLTTSLGTGSIPLEVAKIRARDIMGKFEGQNDYCYKEMLREFKEFLDKHYSQSSGMIVIDTFGEEYQALQSQLEE